MRIAVIAPSPVPARTANSMQVMKMTQAMAKLGHAVRLAVPRGADRLPDWRELAHHYGLEQPFPIEVLPAQASLRRYDYAWHAVRWARRIHADLVYTRLPQAAALASRIGCPTVLEVHDLPRGRLGPALLRFFLRGRGAVRLVAITRALADDLQRKFGVPIDQPFTLVAPDGVDLSRYAGLPSVEEARRRIPALEGLASRFIAGYTGHLYAGRGADLLFELAQRLPKIVFLLVGGEPEAVAHLQSQARARQLDNLMLTGFVPNAELPIYQAACDVLLMPYQRRVAASSGGDIAPYLSPMKLFEYLACGRAILSSDLPVLREVLTPENSLLLPADDVDAWARALLALKDDPQLRARLGEQARQDAARYTWEMRAEAILRGLERRLE